MKNWMILLLLLAANCFGGDEGFRYKSGACVNDRNESGYNFNYFGQCTDFSEMILGGFDLSRVDFSGSKFKGTDFRFSKLDNANLTGANLQDAKLNGTSLIEASLENANAQGADFEGTIADAVMVRGANFEMTSFKGAQFIETDFTETKISRIQASQAEMEGSDFSGLDMSDSDFFGANLREAIFFKSQLNRASFKEAKMAESNLAQSQGEEASFEAANLRKAQMSETVFKNANFNKTILDQAVAPQSDWSGANLANAILQNADLRMTNLKGTMLRGTNFTGAKIDGAQLEGAIFDDRTLIALSPAERRAAGMVYLPVYDIALPPFGQTFSSANLTRGLWFKAPEDMVIVALKVPNENRSDKQNVGVYISDQVFPEFATTISVKPAFKMDGVDSAKKIETDIEIKEGQYVGILGAGGDQTMLHNSYTSVNGPFDTMMLGQSVKLFRLVTQINFVGQNGSIPLSANSGGRLSRVEFWVSPATK